MSERRAEGVLLSGRSLVLQNVTRQKSGNYSCRAATERGEGVARAMDLRVQCESGAARAMDLRVQCETRGAGLWTCVCSVSLGRPGLWTCVCTGAV